MSFDRATSGGWLDGAADDIGAAFDRADVSFDRASGLQRAMEAEASGFISHGGRLLEQMGGFFDDVNDSLEEQAAGAATRLKYVLRENGETARELLHLPDAAAQRAAENLRAKYEAIKQDPHSDEHEEVEEGAVIIAMHTRRWLSGTYRRRRQLIVLQLSVAKAAGVENCRQLGLPDPYCRINLEGRYASLARETRVGWRKSEDKGEGEAKREYGKTLDPLWGEQFILMVQYEDELVLQLQLRDKESVLADTPMGHVHVPIPPTEIARLLDKPTDYEVRLRGADVRCKCGRERCGGAGSADGCPLLARPSELTGDGAVVAAAAATAVRLAASPRRGSTRRLVADGVGAGSGLSALAEAVDRWRKRQKTRAEENVGTIKFTLAAKRLDLDDVPIRKALGNRVVRELRPPAQASRRAPGEALPEVSMRLRCWDGTTAAASPAAVWNFPDGKKGAVRSADAPTHDSSLGRRVSVYT